MREKFGDLWMLAGELPTAVVVVTTNGTVKRDGRLVMGRGVAKEALERYPNIDEKLGQLVSINGNVPQTVRQRDGRWIFSMPVKHHWREMADPELIIKSALELQELKEAWSEPGKRVWLMPRPGCGNGGLDWGFVKPLINSVLDDDFVAVSWVE